MSLLKVEHIAKSFGGVKAINDVSFELPKGQLLALLGPNGAGKSTCFNMLNGQLRPDSGSIKLEGVELVGKHPRQIWRAGVGRTFQISATFGSLTVLENLQMVLLSRYKKLNRWWKPVTHYFQEEAMVLLDQVGMADQADRACSVLAYGDVKRVELAMALAHEPTLLLMDEPTAGMAPRERNQLIALVKKMVVDRNLSVLFTEHSMDVVFEHADRMMVFARGELIADGDSDMIRNDARVREVYFGSGKSFEAA
ncbi:ABC transporter ATP-binding protein [Neptunomonas phycophila]|jgi:branched-chain amino acid transport system ATP-binding protein|uniref:ABC transporter ATP-binding protein n=1 Tax=Neptunomonas phycophila TaxID=1572645 RepID=A0AAW7XG20_9GAMM|nr:MULTISPECIES: ABC transporter ATP-binding protein [Neptunomonas]MBT3145731.1 ABC transporter ATP-binding protein [Neptunomonas phycophila]MDN2660228.1 ABC transporter ATP-binding protein [Neptunomonas sp. CHC150]MDO6453253.1 ABC transporter ATP-binding protein [Neptunomonas phycophila]MDO6469356.1 ABC transporter ATP-binding protein [Neptunomonas phycophila]MDP2522901.1 ABC transporter ATP-binding protein [Neptunomonas phycophila]